MIEHLVRGLKTENAELQQHCASAIFKVRGQARSLHLAFRTHRNSGMHL